MPFSQIQLKCGQFLSLHLQLYRFDLASGNMLTEQLPLNYL